MVPPVIAQSPVSQRLITERSTNVLLIAEALFAAVLLSSSDQDILAPEIRHGPRASLRSPVSLDKFRKVFKVINVTPAWKKVKCSPVIF